MKYLRFISRYVAVFLLLEIIQVVFFPYYSFALSGGTHQVEYTSYEDAGSTDMVNLITGDFTFNLPLLDIPGPEGSFSLPLSYHAGIGSEQEASWVGLGFNINAGAIIRNINQYPDDAISESNEITVQNLTHETIFWNRVFNHPLKDDWNSQTGYHGNINLLDMVEVDFGNRTDVGIAGFHVGDEGFHFNTYQFAISAVNVVTWGYGSAATTAISIAQQAAIGLAINTAVSFVMPLNRPEFSTAGYWRPTFEDDRSFKFHKEASLISGIPVVSKKITTSVWMDQTRTEDMYGVLYSGYAPLEDKNIALKINGISQALKCYPMSTATSNRGSASDINFGMNQRLYYNNSNQIMPTILAHDSYLVNAQGVSGSISPYRLEVGSVAMPREMTTYNSRYAHIPFLQYKVPFLYEGSIFNSYYYNTGSGSSTVSSPDFYYGLDMTVDPGDVHYDLYDVAFQNDKRLSEDVKTIKRVPQGNHIEWFSNEEIISNLSTTQVCPSNFIDFLKADNNLRYSFRTSKPAKGIGGYSITSSEGVTYHFSLPAYEFDKYSESVKIADANVRNSIERKSPFANTWLLTSITGPDFIDRNSNGLADDNDWGYWVKMNYGKHADAYDWRSPYQEGMAIADPTNTFNSFEKGKREMYYLNSVETGSHIALFMKSTREDGKSASGSISPLKLDEICLLDKKKYIKLLTSPYNIVDYANNISTLCLSSQYAVAATRDYINKNCIRRIMFNYNYDLCKATPNAGGTSNVKKGKLTLQSISINGRNDVKIFPDFKFYYGENIDYAYSAWDGWGMSINPIAWSLNKIKTPLGSDISINYERDSYSSISGLPIAQKSGGNLRVGSIVVNDQFGKQNKVRYLYQNDDGSSSGVVSQEPEYVRGANDEEIYPFYNYLGYPRTPVLYGKVSVLNGQLTSDTDYETKQIFEFETPTVLNLDFGKQDMGSYAAGNNRIEKLLYKLKDRTSRIGKLNSIEILDKAGNTTSQSLLTYTEQIPNDAENNYQGTFTESTLLMDYSSGSNPVRRLNRTTIIKYPYTLQKITNSKDGMSSSRENLKWDQLTGMVTESSFQSPLGLYVKTVKELAYKKVPAYAEFGSKAYHSSSKNMLTQISASYSYLFDNVGNELGLIGASAYTWRKDWDNYRVLSGGVYGDSQDLCDLNNDQTISIPEKEAQKIWRKSQSYAWVGTYSKLNQYGVQNFTTADKFNFSTSDFSTSNPLWKMTGSFERFDHNTHILETKDIKGLSSSTKFGYETRLPLASAANAAYEEIAYCGAEDLLNTTPKYFGGEVALGSGTVVASPVHTGKSALSLNPNVYGFVYKSSKILTGKSYRASVWSNSTKGRIYFKLLGSTTEGIPTSETISPGILLNGTTWYRYDILIDVPKQSFSAGSIEIGVRSLSGTAGAVVFDDFRFQPFESVMTCNVYNPLTFDLEYVLDNDNVYTRYKYDDRGILVSTYIESVKPGQSGEKLVTETRQDFRRFHIDQ